MASSEFDGLLSEPPMVIFSGTFRHMLTVWFCFGQLSEKKRLSFQTAECMTLEASFYICISRVSDGCKIVSDMTYSVFAGTLNPTQLIKGKARFPLPELTARVNGPR